MKFKLSKFSIMPNLNRLAKAATVAALTLGMAVVAQPAQKASAQFLGRVSITPLSGYAWEGGNGKQVTYVNISLQSPVISRKYNARCGLERHY